MNSILDKIEKTVQVLAEDNDKLRDCVKLIQSILNHGDFNVETPNEGALVKALEFAEQHSDWNNNCKIINKN